MKRTAVCVAVLVGVTLSVGLTANDDWAQFRGPGARGVVEDQNLPETWSTTENVAWVTEIPGLGWSSPIVSGDTVFLTSVVSNADVEAPRGGALLRRRTVDTDRGPSLDGLRHGRGDGGASLAA